MGDQKKKKKKRMTTDRVWYSDRPKKRVDVNHSFGKRETSSLEMFYVDK